MSCFSCPRSCDTLRRTVIPECLLHVPLWICNVIHNYSWFFYFSPNSSQELVEQEDRWCEGGLNLFPIHLLAKLRCIKNMSTWQWLRIILQENIVYPSGCLLVVCPEILRSLIGSVSNSTTIQLIYQTAVWHYDQFHFNSNFQVLQEIHYILAIKIYLDLSAIK